MSGLVELEDHVFDDEVHQEVEVNALNFDDDVRPYVYLDEGSFFISLRRQRKVYTQIMELNRMGSTVDERVRKFKECLQVSMSDARVHFGLPDMLLEEDGKFMDVIQRRILFRMLFKPDEILWVYTGKMLVPMWAVAHAQYWTEKTKDGFVEEFFFRGCLFAVLHVIENFSIPGHRFSEVPDDPPPCSKWFSKSIPEKQRDAFRSAVQDWWSFSTVLMMNNTKRKEDWKPVRTLFEYKVPADLPSDQTHDWKCTFHDIISSKYDRDAHVGIFLNTINSKISLMYLPYCIRTADFSSIPTDVSRIQMHFRDETAMNQVDLWENLFFYVVAAMMLRKKSSRSNYRMILLKFLLSKKHSYDELNDLFDEELQKLSENSIEYNEGLEILLHDIDISQDCRESMMSEKENITAYVLLLKKTDILSHAYFQTAMVNVARCVFAFSEAYCGLKLKDNVSERRNNENIKKACFIKMNGYVQMNTPERHGERVKDILSEAEELISVEAKPPQMGTSYRDVFGVVRGVGSMSSRGWASKHADRGLGNNLADTHRATQSNAVDQDEFFLSQQSISSLFERFFCDAVLYYTMPEFCNDTKKTNFLVFLSPFHICTYPREVLNKIKEHPWNYNGCMLTKPASDVAADANFASYVTFAKNMDKYIFSPGDKTNFESFIDMKSKFDEICASCMNVRMFISSVNLNTSSGFSFGIPGVGIIRTTHYSWYPKTSDPTSLFGSRYFELTKNSFPLHVWSKDAVLSRRGPETVVTYPVPCGICMKFSEVMYTRFRHQKDEFRCSFCVPSGDFFVGWNPVSMYDEFGLVCGVGNSLISGRHVVWTTGWLPSLKNEVSSMRKPSKPGTSIAKRPPTFLLGRANKIPKMENVDVSHELVFDWLCNNPDVISTAWLDRQYVVRPKGAVSLEWQRVFEEVTSCKCYDKLRSWKISKKFCRLKPSESDARLGRRPCPTFMCCGKDTSLNSSLFSPMESQKFDRAQEILNLPRLSDDDHLTLKRCNDFLKLFYTLFSERGCEYSLRESCSWRGDDDVPSHCMFFEEEKIDIPLIRCVCMETLGFDTTNFDRARIILALPLVSHEDRMTLMQCNDFMSLFYTLFSESGQERLNIPYIRGVCMETLGMYEKPKK